MTYLDANSLIDRHKNFLFSLIIFQII